MTYWITSERSSDLTMTSGFSTIAGSVLSAYIGLGVPPQTLITSSVMSIPASMSISKMRLPELDEPVTRGRVSIDRGEEEAGAPVCFHFIVTSAAIERFPGQCTPCVQSRCYFRSHCCRSDSVRQ